MDKTDAKLLSSLAALMAALSLGRAEPLQPAKAGQPTIAFNTTNYDSGTTGVGDMVRCVFLFTNTGSGPLLVSNVTGSCGCTTAGAWTREVVPGQSGSIPVQIRTVNLAPGPLNKSVTVTSNDKSHPTTILHVTGTLYKLIDIDPSFAFLHCSTDALDATATVRIVSHTGQPITLGLPQPSQPSLRAELQTVQPGKEFRLILTTVPSLLAQSAQPHVTIPTSLSNAPTLTVPAFINVQPAISIIPPEISLPAPPLARALSPVITVVNNNADPLALSQASVNAPEAAVAVKETKPGKQFQFTLTFPQGFASAPGQPLELTVHSSNPKHPLLKVPIKQLARSEPSLIGARP